MLKLLRLKLSLEEMLGTLKMLDGKILNLTKEDDLGDEIDQADSFKEGIYVSPPWLKSRSFVWLCTPPQSHIGPWPLPPIVESSRVKLPKLSLKPFGRDITAWMTFWESYESAIHKNPTLSDIDKFNYLKSLLDGTAHEAIVGLTLTLCQLSWGSVHSPW